MPSAFGGSVGSMFFVGRIIDSEDLRGLDVSYMSGSLKSPKELHFMKSESRN
jgi:hypothetical protein